MCYTTFVFLSSASTQKLFEGGCAAHCCVLVSRIRNYENWTGCGFDREKEVARGKAEENDRKADFMLGKLHLICFQGEWTAFGPACVFTAT